MSARLRFVHSATRAAACALCLTASTAAARGGSTTETLTALVSVERALLAEAAGHRVAGLAREGQAARDLAAARVELAAAYRASSSAAAAGTWSEDNGRVLEAALDTHRRAQEEAERLASAGRLLDARAAAHERRLVELEARIEALRASAPAPPPLEGTWDVVIGPMNDRGWFELRQEGTLVSGLYELNSGRSGSVTGTFVDGRLKVQQVDARVGLDATFFAVHSPAEGKLAGTWESAIHGSGRPAHGDWTGRLRRSESADAGPAQDTTPSDEPVADLDEEPEDE